MTLQDQVRTALSNVGRRKLRSTLASLGVVVGVVTIVVLVSLAEGVRQQINRQFASIGLDRLVVNPTGSGGRGGRGNPFGFLARRKNINPQEVKKWSDLPGVTKVMPEVNLPSDVGLELDWHGTNQPVRLDSMDFRPGNFFQEMPQALAGTLEPTDSGGIIVSRGAARAAGISSNEFARVVGQDVEVTLRTPRGEKQTFKLQLQGVAGENSAAIRVSVADRVAMKNWWFNTTNVLEREGYDSVMIRTKDVSRANDLSVELRRQGYQVQSLEAVMAIANRIVTVITIMFTLVGGIALLVAAIGITNTMVMAIYERTREIGILKAMGASNSEVRRMFMFEAGFIGMTGGAIGVVMGWLAGLVLNKGVQVYAHYRELPVQDHLFLVTVPLVVVVIVFATLIGIVAGLLPAQRAASLNPLDALRHE